MMRQAILACFVSTISRAYAASISLASIAVDDLVNPLAVNTTTPTFSWAVNSPSVRGAGIASVQVQVLSRNQSPHSGLVQHPP